MILAGNRNFQHAQILLAGQHFVRSGGEGRGDQHFDEMLARIHRCDDLRIDGAVEGQDAAESRGGIGLESLFISGEQAVSDGHAAGIGVLDDDAGRCAEGFDAFPGGVGVGDVVVGELLALQLSIGRNAARCRCRIAVESRLLMGVLAVTQGFDAVEGQLQVAGET